MRLSKLERETQVKNALKQLRDYLPAGSTVYTILREVSRSGMSRQISVVAFNRDDEGATLYPLHLTNLVGLALDIKTKRGGFNDALTVRGCGADMGFEIVCNLARALGYDKDDNGRIPVNAPKRTNAYGLNHEWL